MGVATGQPYFYGRHILLFSECGRDHALDADAQLFLPGDNADEFFRHGTKPLVCSGLREISKHTQNIIGYFVHQCWCVDAMQLACEGVENVGGTGGGACEGGRGGVGGGGHGQDEAWGGGEGGL